MTERFEIFPQNVAKDGTLIIIQKGLKLYNISDVVELLNALRNENEQLKSENIKLTVDNKELKCSNNELYQENEQLKSENKKQATALKNLCHVEICEICEHQEWIIDETPYGTEYDTRCKKGFEDYNEKFYGVDVQKCDDFELRRSLYE